MPVTLKPVLLFLRRIWHGLLPADCLWCTLPLNQVDHALCTYCNEALPELPFALCHYNLLWLPAVAAGLKHAKFDQLLSLAMYHYPYKLWITRWKFNQDLAAGQLLLQQFKQLLLDYHATGATLPQAIVYVPMHRKKQRKRGFNQALLLAEVAADSLQLPLLHLFSRGADNHSQVGLDRKARKQNLQQAFELILPANSALPLHLALIDDVVTTGATANRLCSLLRQHGVQSISLWTLAVTPAPD